MKKSYLRLALNKKGIMYKFQVHRLVGFAFICNPYNKEQINHKNGIKTDNRVENLEWVTNSENIKHAMNAGLKKSPFGEQQGNHILYESDVLEIRKLKNKIIKKELAMRFGVTIHTIRQIHMNKSWRHLL